MKHDAIDWEEQWALFAQNFKDGKAHIDLSEFGCPTPLLLWPGAGFGDLSHPTTLLMIKMMHEKVKNATVLDIGTGSGILSLAALLLGARFATGIDIDSNAIAHAKKNAKLNHLELKTTFHKTIPSTLHPNPICLMNMLPHEQQGVRMQHLDARLWITSGVLKERKEEYLKQTEGWGWQVVEEHHHMGWMGWVFETKPVSTPTVRQRKALHHSNSQPCQHYF